MFAIFILYDIRLKRKAQLRRNDMRQENCKNLVERDKKVIASCQHLSYFPLAVAKAEGSVITDEDGNHFIDFLSAASSLNLGSSNPVITAALREQLTKYAQYCQVYTYNRTAIEYAERLVSVYPGGVRAKLVYGNSGSDCNDAAVKFARGYTGRQKIIVFQNAYHGATCAAAAMTTCSLNMHAKIGPLLPEIYVFPYFGIDRDDADVEENCVRQMEEAFSSYLPANEVAAVLIEPIQGDSGILPAHPVFMKKLHELCRKNGILFISEEVQMALWRSGTFFGIEHYGIVPDAIVMGKSVGMSVPLGVFMARAEILEHSLAAPAHAFTLCGNALACAAGIAAFDYMQTPEFQKILAGNSALLAQLSDEIKAKHPRTVGFVRHIGMSAGIGIVLPDGSPDRDGVFKTLFRCYEKGLLVISLAANVLRIQPPLNIEPELMKQGFAIIDEALGDYEAGKIGDDVLAYRAGW